MKDNNFVDYVKEQLSEIPQVHSRSMFGGFGLYADKIFFGIILKDTFFIKVSKKTRAAFEARGMKPFRPSPKQTLTQYYEVDSEDLENRDLIVNWVREVISEEI